MHELTFWSSYPFCVRISDYTDYRYIGPTSIAESAAWSTVRSTGCGCSYFTCI